MNKHSNSVDQINQIKSQQSSLIQHDLPLAAQLLALALREQIQDRNQLLQVEALFLDFKTQLATHQAREIQTVYPAILRHQSGHASIGQAVEYVTDMVNDHRELTLLLGQIRQLTDHYRPSLTASQTVKLAWSKLAQIEKSVCQLFETEMRQTYAEFTA